MEQNSPEQTINPKKPNSENRGAVKTNSSDSFRAVNAIIAGKTEPKRDPKLIPYFESFQKETHHPQDQQQAANPNQSVESKSQQGTLDQQPKTPDESKTESQGLLIREFNNYRGFGTMIGRIAQERDERRLVPYLDSKLFPREEYSFLQPKPEGQDVTQEDVAKAAKGAFGVALEVAAQISEVQLARHGQIREDSESLEQMMRMLKGAENIRTDLMETNPQAVEDESRKAVARRLKVAPDQVQMSQDQLTQWARKQLDTAYKRIYKGADALSRYNSM